MGLANVNLTDTFDQQRLKINQSILYLNEQNLLLNLAFDTTNAAFRVVNAAYTSSNADYVVTNAAFTQSNTDNVRLTQAYRVLNAAYTSANANYVVTNSVFEQSNTDNVRLSAAYVVINSAFTQSNTDNVRLTGAFNVLNSAYTSANANYVVTNAAFTQSNTDNVRLTSAFNVLNAAYTSANANYVVTNTAFNVTNAAFTQANTDNVRLSAAYVVLNSAFTQANTDNVRLSAAYVLVNSAFSVTNSSFGRTNNVFNFSNTIFDFANGVNANSSSGYAVANAGYDQANTARDRANDAVGLALQLGANAANIILENQASFNTANGAFNTANQAFGRANGAFGVLNTAFGVTNAAFTMANGTVINAAAGFARANDAFANIRVSTLASNVYTDVSVSTANTAIQSNIRVSTTAANTYALGIVTTANAAAYGNIASSTIAANNYAGAMANSSNAWTTATFLRLSSASQQSISSDISVTGNLTVTGTTTYVNTNQLSVGDNIITLNADVPVSTAPTQDAGIEINRGSSTNVSVLWNESSDRWTFTNDGTNYRLIASNTDVDSANNFAVTTAGNMISANLTTSREYTNTSTTAANNYAGAMANSGNAWAAATFGTATNTAAAFARANSVASGANGFAIQVGASGNAYALSLVTGYLPISGGTLTGRVIQSTSGFGVATRDNISTRTDSGFWQTSVSNTALGWPETDSWYNLITSTHNNDSNYFSMQFAGDFYNSNDVWYRATNGSGLAAWNRLWHSGNDGAGSGLDADLLDGQQGSFYAPINNPTFTGTVSVPGPGLYIRRQDNAAEGGEILFQRPTSTILSGDVAIDIQSNSIRFFDTSSTRGATLNVAACATSTQSILIHSTNFNSYAPTLTGGGASGTWGINISGTAATATSATNATNATNASNATLATKASTLSQNGGNGSAMTFFWSGQSGQPTWLWGGNDGVNHYVYNPSNFSVAYAANAGNFNNGNLYSTGNQLNSHFGTEAHDQELAINYVGFNNGSAYRRNTRIFNGQTGQIALFNASDGVLYCYNNIVAYASSDRNLKTNIVNIPNALDKVKQINGVEFDWTEEYLSKALKDEYFNRKHDVGVIAQEIEKVLPEVVATREDGVMAVKYDRLVPLLIEAIKELSSEVDILKNKLGEK